MSPEKKAAIANFIEMYDIKSVSDIQEALKDLLGGTIQGVHSKFLIMSLHIKCVDKMMFY
jgi:hypothetical protein